MKVSAKDIMGAWVELDRTAPYHTDQKPIGHDRKQHEIVPTNDDFKNTWMPTAEPEAEPCAQEQIEVVQVEVVRAMRRKADEGYILPGVPERLFRVWEQAHDAGLDFNSDFTESSLDRFTQFLAQFAHEATRVGVQVEPTEIEALQNYTQTHRPDRGDEYSPAKAEEILFRLDKALGKLHSEVARVTRTQKEQWYEIQDSEMKGLLHDRTQVMPLTPEEEAELGIKNRMSPQQLRDQRGPGAPFMEEMWQRKRRNELTGMRILAADIIRQPNQPQTPPEEEFHEMNPEDEVPGQQEFRQMTEGNPLAEHDPQILAMTIGEAGEWNETDSEVTPPGSVFSYSKDIALDEDYEKRLEIIAFVMPLAARKKILLERVQSLRKYNPQQAQEFEEEAYNTPDRGYISDIEISYPEGGELIYHRERSFVPKQALTDREFMAGDSMQRAITDIQQFVRTKIDPIPVGQFIEAALRNPGKGEQKLSMRINAADVRPFDPSKRRPKPGPKTFGLGPSPSLQEKMKNLHPLPKADDQMSDSDFEDGMRGSDYEGLLYMYDTAASDLNDIASGLIQVQPGLDPVKQKEAGAIIAKLKAAIRALSA